ncbi:predicted protein [Naegleria gruberi]|uniref:Predicted protein n=1 Tax=Naegleria gruberi TaxID=5762 RepID=D2VWH9_NAEGR|nr:uncharacterized protein NAEGRDRAFT_81485 [Naegleria gruberi]EFC38843.1 predicted protein [Naegleria gruberi]|eukprot:XP_002671587.1 predicted protein [Naegleria gruberi strain NEG-M]
MSSYCAINKERKKLNHPSLIRWIKEEKRISSKKQNQQQFVEEIADEDGVCRKCFPDGMVNESVQQQQEEDDDNRKVRFTEHNSEDAHNTLSDLTNSEAVNAKTELHKKVIFMHHQQNRRNVIDKAEQTSLVSEDEFGKLSDENLFGKVHYLLSSIKSNRVETNVTPTKITNMTLDDDEPRPSNLNISPSSLFCGYPSNADDQAPLQNTSRETPSFENELFHNYSLPKQTVSPNISNLTLADASRQIQSMYNHITSVYGSEPLNQRQIIFEKTLNIGITSNNENDTVHDLNYIKDKVKKLRSKRLQEIKRNLEFERVELMKNPKIGDLKKRISDLKRKIEKEYEKDELFRKQRLKETNRLKLVKNTPKAEEKLKMFLNALNANYSNTCYQVTIYEGEISTCLAKLFLIYLKIEKEIQKSRDILLTKLNDEMLENCARNTFYAFKNFTKKQQDLRQQQQRFDNYITHRRKVSLFAKWKESTKSSVTEKEKDEVAMIHYYNNLQRKAFNSIAFVLNSMILKRCAKELSFMWRDRQILGKGFFGWRHQSEKTKYLKQGLMRFAVSDSFDELDRFKSEYEIESYMSYKIRLNFRTKITKHLIQLYREKKSLVSKFEHTPKLRYIEYFTKKPIDLSTIYKIEEYDQRFKHFNYLKKHDSRPVWDGPPEEQYEPPLYSKSSFQKASIPNLTEQVYDIRLKKKIFQQWSEKACDKILKNRADQFYSDVTKRKVLYVLRENRDDIYEKSLQIQDNSNATMIVKYFNKWRETTELVSHEKDSIASEYYNITLARKAFQALKTTCLVDYNPHLNDLCKQWLVKSKERYFKRWKLMLFLRKSEEKFELAVAEQYQMTLKFKLLTAWREKAKKRQLLRKVLTDGANRMKAKTTVLENKKSLAKYVLKQLKKNKEVKISRKNQYFMFIKSKKFYDDALKQKFFQLWKIKQAIGEEQKKLEQSQEEKEKTAIALNHYNQVIKKKIIKSWREYTLETNFVDIFILRKAFENWRIFAAKSTEEPKHKFKKNIFQRWKAALREKNEMSSLNSLAERFHERKLAQKSMGSIKEYIVQQRIEHVQLIRANQYYKESLMRKVLIGLLINVNTIRDKRRKREKADLFYHKKLVQSSLESPLSLDRFLNARPNSPFFFAKTVNIVYYKLLIKGIDSWTFFVKKEKEKRLMLAKAVHANASNLVAKCFNLWRIKSKLQSHKHPKFITKSNITNSKIVQSNISPALSTNIVSPILHSSLTPQERKILIHHHHYLIATDSDDDDIVDYLNIIE